MELAHKGRSMEDPKLNPEIWHAVSALAGSVCSQILSKQKLTLGRVVGLGVVGMLTGIFLNPAICQLAGLHDENLRSGMAFVCGLVGISMCTVLMAIAESSGFSRWVAKLFGQDPPATPPAPSPK